MRQPRGLHLSGMLLVALSAAAFGTLAIFGRVAYADGMDTFTILFLRFALAAVLMLALLVVRREGLPRGPVLLWLIGMGAIGYAGQSFCYLTALKYASPGLVALLLYLYPVFVTILSVFVLHDAITPVKAAALLLALLGVALTVGPAGGQTLGILLAIGAALIYSVYIIVGAQALRQVSVTASSAVIFASAGATYGLLMAVNGPHLPQTPAGWGAIAGMVVIATTLAAATFLAGLERVGPANASMLSALEPVVTLLLAALLFNETLTPLGLFGGALILAAVLILARSEMRRSGLVQAPQGRPDPQPDH